MKEESQPTETNTPERTPSGNTFDSADIEYRYYRQSGTALSATIITFSTVMIGWSLQAAKNYETIKGYYYPQILFYLLAVISAFLIQLFNYFGYQHQARRNYEKPNTARNVMQKANRWFTKMDRSVIISCIFLAIGFMATVVTWFVPIAE